MSAQHNKLQMRKGQRKLQPELATYRNMDDGADGKAPERAPTGYLPHLDGLRAFALLGVLGFHFEVPYFSGGYVGVDCFLVLSGYLMTRNIISKVQGGIFNMREFYIRRFWRLYPSALVTIFVTTIVASQIFPPALSQRVAQSALSSKFLVSNLYFYSQQNYFDVASRIKPLLHMWSLSLEGMNMGDAALTVT